MLLAHEPVGAASPAISTKTRASIRTSPLTRPLARDRRPAQAASREAGLRERQGGGQSGDPGPAGSTVIGPGKQVRAARSAELPGSGQNRSPMLQTSRILLAQSCAL